MALSPPVVPVARPATLALCALFALGCRRGDDARRVTPPALDAGALDAISPDVSQADVLDSPPPTGPRDGASVTVVVPREATGDVVVRVDARTIAGARGGDGTYRCRPEVLARGAHLVVVERPACGASASRYVFVDSERPREFVAAAPSCP